MVLHQCWSGRVRPSARSAARQRLSPLRTSVYIAAATTVLAACVAGVERPPEPAHASIASSDTSARIRCPSATLTNRDDLREALRTAMADACEIFESDEFRATIESSQLARKCPTLPFKKHKLLPGPEIYRRLAEGMPTTITVRAERVGWNSTIAITNTATRSISIKPERFSDWLGNDRSERAAMINTLIHEMTHFVEPTPGAGFAYFRDGGQWTPWCDQDLLVSYALGKRAETQWLTSHP